MRIRVAQQSSHSATTSRKTVRSRANIGVMAAAGMSAGAAMLYAKHRVSSGIVHAEGGIPAAVRAPSTAAGWQGADADGNVEDLGGGPAIKECMALGKAVHVHCCPTGTLEFLQAQSDPDPYQHEAIDATVRAMSSQPMSRHPPRFLIMSGSLREGSCSRRLAVETGRVLAAFGADVKFFDAKGLPIYSEDLDPNFEPKVKELWKLLHWCEGMVWISPEYHGNYSAALKNQVDWMPLNSNGVRPTQGKTLAVMQVCGGSQSFNTVNNLRTLGRWMRLVVIPNQASIPVANKHFAPDGTMYEGGFRARIVDVAEELYKFTVLLRDQQSYLSQRYSEQTTYKSGPEVRQTQAGAG